MEQTIREKVIQLAQQDPFLSIKQIAKEADTTRKYARSVLSSNGYSLNEMRRERFLYMEARVEELEKENQRLKTVIDTYKSLDEKLTSKSKVG